MVARDAYGGGVLLLALICSVSSALSHGYSVGGVATARPHQGLYQLPPLLEFANGTHVTDAAALAARRAEARQLLADTFYGHFPKDVPVIAHVEWHHSTVARQVNDSFVNITYRTAQNISITIQIELLIPSQCTAAHPCPLFLTQGNHRRWALAGVGRGYVGLVYPGADSLDQTDGFRLAYPDATWGLIARRAWLGMRVLDYAIELPFIQPDQVCITGHSRNGKQSMIFAAWDERISAVISSSSGAPAMSPYRMTSSFTLSESPYGTWPNAPPELNCSCTRNPTDPRPLDSRCCWWLPSVVDYDGRENEMPIDSHALLLLIAPRPFLSECALNDPCDPTFAVESSYQAARPVYALDNATDRLRIHYRDGQHHGFEEIQNYFDFFDAAFQRSSLNASIATAFPELLFHNFSWASWSVGRKPLAFPSHGSTTTQIRWLLGETEEHPLPWSPGGGYGLDSLEYIEQMFGTGDELVQTEGNVTKMAVNFGPYLQGNLYYPKGADQDNTPRPAIIWLHPYSYQRGYTEDYPRDSERAYSQLAQAGYVVLTYHQAGFGHRLQEKRSFYHRFPEWSLLGKLVQDVSSAFDFLAAPFNGSHPDGLDIHDQLGQWYPPIQPEHMYVVGYAMGGIVGTYACALDARCAGMAALAALSPLRNDTLASTTGGLWTLYEQHALQPELGWYREDAEALPLDYDAVLAALGRRPALVVDQVEDRTVNHPALAALMHNVTQTQPNVQFQTLSGPSQLNDALIQAALDFVGSKTLAAAQ
ncbi:uncharacterized protein MONBRDRAFT_27421 [Monosiga brevicollis MX1]|uniref:(4-O-methyl)-D-glucuronate--lignin esterase n=1 Tax=Monosiga brevicollis TaxID=81824 RepID=A9V584_MONBE|nr:uncharacterized protein MONBRDRAFT_27421 [Monosiga brevicollis MX1]EDQ87230.1 predicted protein [Monosiga brevicollis MX1]|eukprot:XP_001747843.1 hypothetical protein [Monosiga brevicollis MX1]